MFLPAGDSSGKRRHLGMTARCNWCGILVLLALIPAVSHLLSAIKLQQNSSLESPHTKSKKKYDNIVLGPPAGVGLPDRLQCQGIKALNKTHYAPFSLNTGKNVVFVTMFASYGVAANFSSISPTDTFSYSKEQRALAILNVFINFIMDIMPQSSIVILTDPVADIPLHRDKVDTIPIQGEYSRDKLMLQRIRSYIAFLEVKYKEVKHYQKQSYVTHYIFTDSDIAVVDDLGQLFHKNPNFHIALTFRNNKEQPLNSGFIAVKGSADGLIRSKVFLEKVLEIYTSKYTNASRMLGDQLALAWIVKSHPTFDARRFSKPQAFTDKIANTSVLFLPCALYNWTPPEGAGQFHGMPLDVKVIHFKGSRKRLMLEAWKFYSSSLEISDMLCLILRSGRTKYDF